MKEKWIPCDKFLPDKDGIYLVTTVNGKIRMDRFVDGEWGMCKRCRIHLAWTYLPKPYEKKGANDGTDQ